MNRVATRANVARRGPNVAHGHRYLEQSRYRQGHAEQPATTSLFVASENGPRRPTGQPWRHGGPTLRRRRPGRDGGQRGPPGAARSGPWSGMRHGKVKKG